jgi:ElaA protein
MLTTERTIRQSHANMYTKTFEQLTKNELYALAKLRQQVFIIEQNSIYSDLDDYDQTAMHYLDFGQQDNLIVYARYRKISQLDEVKIERVVLAAQARGLGLGKSLMVTMLKDIQGEYPLAKITLSHRLMPVSFISDWGLLRLVSCMMMGLLCILGWFICPIGHLHQCAVR